MNRGYSTLALCAVGACSILGVILAFSIPSAVFPQIQFDRAIVLANSGDLPSAQMLAAVTRPLEEAAYGVMNVRLVRSTTSRGSTEIDVDFSDGSDPVSTFQLLEIALNEVRLKLPPGTDVRSRLLTTGTFPILEIAMSSRERSLPSLTDIANYDLLPSLHRINGVYRVETVGAKMREYVVRLNPAKMLQHNLSPAEVVAGLAAANVIQSPGRVMDRHRMLLTVVSAELHDADQLAALSIGNSGGQPVYVRDIATVELGIAEDYIRTSSQDGAALLVDVSQQASGNTIQISKETHPIITDFRARYPDVSFSVSYDQAALVSESFKSVRDAIVLGLILAVVVVLLFTWSLISTAVAALVVPCTIAITFVVMKGAGTTFNMMSLGGLAAGIGLFIDDAIVVIEAIHRAHQRGERGESGVVNALTELIRPLIASTATVVVVFAPLIFLSGVTGVFFRALALTLGGGLLVSLLLALFFNPALEQLLEPWRRPVQPAGRLSKAVESVYLSLLHPFISAPFLAILAASLSLAGACILYRGIGTDYLPALDEGAFVLDYITPPQSTLHDTDTMLSQIEAVLRSTPEVAAFARRTGTQLGFFLTESNRGDMSVRLKNRRERDIDTIISSIRQRIITTVPNVEIEFSQMLQDLIGDLSGTPEPVVIKVFGSDPGSIQTIARRIAALITPIAGLVDVKNGIILSSPEEQILVDSTGSQRYGLDADQIRSALDAVVDGTVATQLRVGDRLDGVRVRYPSEYRQDLALLPPILLKNASGGMVPLSSLTTFHYLGESTELDRERLRPVLYVTARTSGLDLGAAIAEVQAKLARLQLPPGVTLEYGGLYAEQQTAFRQLELVLVAGIISMFLVLLWEFGRLLPAIAVLLGALSCLAGSFIALDLTGLTLNISSFMGIIMVAGITAKNGILLLDHAEHDVRRGAESDVALVTAARIRLRPILMTTLATAAGLAPLALGIGAEAKVQQPLAVAVIGGLAFALLLSTPLAGGIYLLSRRRS